MEGLLKDKMFSKKFGTFKRVHSGHFDALFTLKLYKKSVRHFFKVYWQ